MIGLYLLAAHLVGDFVLQDRWQAAGKFTDRRLRTIHVLTYAVPFVPVIVWQAPCAWRAAAFMAGLVLLHWLTDSRRFRSTLGDVLQWRWDAHVHPDAVRQEWLQYIIGEAHLGHGPRVVDVNDAAVRWPTPNPWPPIPLMLDQTLHICQVALLAGLFLT